MRVLYVEDKDDFAATFADLVASHIDGIEIQIARSFSDSLARLNAADFDLVILDLAIPRDDYGHAHVEVGSELARLIRQEFAGTAILIFTGQEDERETDDLLYETRRPVRYLGGEEYPYLSVWRKDRLERVLSILKARRQEEVAAGLIIISNLENGALGASCPEADRKLIRGFCLYRGGARGRVRRLGGLSGSAVYRVDVLADDASVLQRSVAKIDSGSAIDCDLRNYGNHVTRLPGGYPSAIPVDLVAGGRRRAAFYNLADGFDVDLFDLETRPDELVGTIRQKFLNWHGSRWSARCSVRQVVSEIAGDRGLAKLLELKIPGVEGLLENEIDCFRSIQHGDLHGANILCRPDGSDVCIIDFGDVGDFVATLDVVTLELSVFFHPSSSARDYVQPLKEMAVHWFDDATLAASDFPPWLIELRRWARDAALSHLEYAVVVLAYSARQLKYDDTDHNFAEFVIGSAVEQLRDL